MTNEQSRSVAWGLVAVAGAVVLWQLWPRVAEARPVRPPQPGSRPRGERAARQPSEAAPVSLNRASVDELEQLPGIGPELAGRIVNERPFEHVDDLLEVSGIGPATLDKLREDVELS